MLGDISLRLTVITAVIGKFPSQKFETGYMLEKMSVLCWILLEFHRWNSSRRRESHNRDFYYRPISNFLFVLEDALDRATESSQVVEGIDLAFAGQL